MKNLKKAILTSGLAGILLSSGCGDMMLGGHVPTDLSKSRYATTIEKCADDYSKTQDLDKLGKAAIAYGEVGNLKKMDEIINKIIEKDLEKGTRYADIGEKYHDLHN